MPPSERPRGSARILIVDDDHDLVDLLAFALSRAGLTPLVAHDGPTALDLLEKERPHLVLLDVHLGESDGIVLLEQIRRVSSLPVILLTGQSAEDARVRGLESGADDYVTKPFSYRELIARIQVKLRRIDAESAPPMAAAVARPQTVGALELNPASYTVSLGGRRIPLSATEFRLLQYLMARAGAVVPAQTILQDVWGYPDDSNAVDLVRVTVHRIRRKLEEDPANPAVIRTVPGVGFTLNPPPARS